MIHVAGAPNVPRVLLVHGESLFCAGAQRMLAYYLTGQPESSTNPRLACTDNPGLRALLPADFPTLPLPVNQKFSPAGMVRQALAVRRLVRTHDIQVLHGWTARDWEVTSLASLFARVPAVGLLHDHPTAAHISASRQRMMRAAARTRLARVVCVSQAVANACADAGYPAPRLRVVRNGLPFPPAPAAPRPGPQVRLGFLGVFAERKGLRVLFEILDQLAVLRPGGWECHLAGGAAEDTGRRLLEELRATHTARPWWPRLHWPGWIQEPDAFLAALDLLIVPSSEFDPFPTVLLEAGRAARPVLAANVGGVPEIVEDGVTGWIFDPRQPARAAAQLAALINAPAAFERAGNAAAARVRREFSLEAMAAGYAAVYRELVA